MPMAISSNLEIKKIIEGGHQIRKIQLKIIRLFIIEQKVVKSKGFLALKQNPVQFYLLCMYALDIHVRKFLIEIKNEMFLDTNNFRKIVTRNFSQQENKTETSTVENRWPTNFFPHLMNKSFEQKGKKIILNFWLSQKISCSQIFTLNMVGIL